MATTIGKGIIQPEFSGVYVILAGLVGSISWNLITWWFGLPSSSSHALIGGLVGSAIIVGGFEAVVIDGIERIMVFMIVSPAVGFGIEAAFALVIMFFLGKSIPGKVNRVFGRLQILSSAFFSLTHGANNGQKTMGIITSLLISGGMLQLESFVVPLWIVIVVAVAIALDTFFGGWRIVKTAVLKLTNLRPYEGFCAETGGGAILTTMAWMGIPVNTTHAISGAIMGAGSTKRLSAVRWGFGKKIVYAWIITIPASAALAAASI